MLLVVDNGSIYTKQLTDFLLEKNILFEKQSPHLFNLDSLSNYNSFMLSGRRKNEKKINESNSKIITYCIKNNIKLFKISHKGNPNHKYHVILGKNYIRAYKKLSNVAIGNRQEYKEIIKDTKKSSNIWKYSAGHSKSTKDKCAHKHPAIFPESLDSDHIKTWSKEGDLVFDPFMGTGPNGKMEKKLGRKVIGIELDAE